MSGAVIDRDSVAGDAHELDERGDWLASEHRWSPRAVGMGLGVGILACVLAVVFRTEIIASDPWRYVQSARDFPDDSWVLLGYTRYGMILPLLPLTALFGNAAIVYYFWPIASTGALACGLYLIAYRFWGPVIGVLAVILAFVSSIMFINTSRGYPDLLSTATFVLAIVLAFVVRDQLGRRGYATWWLWLMIGLLLGWAFETRETTILVWPIVALVLWKRGKVSLPGPLLLLAGLAVWAITDIAIGAIAYGDPLVRVHAFTRQDLAAATAPTDIAVLEQFVGRSRLFYLTIVPKMLLTVVSGGVWTLLLAALGVLGLAFKGGARFAAIWLIVSYVTFIGITGLFVPDHPSGRIDILRYWIAFLPVIGLAAAGTVAELAVRLRDAIPPRSTRVVGFVRRHTVVVLAVLVTLGPVIALATHAAQNLQLRINGADQLSQLRTYLASHQELTAKNPRMFTDFASTRVAEIYKRPDFGGDELWRARMVDIAVKKPKPRKGDLVVVNSLDNTSCGFCHEWITEWYETRGPIPEDWEEVWASSPRNLVLYRVT